VATRGRAKKKARPTLRLGRALVLGIALVAALLYVEPLRAYFIQQDRHEKAEAALAIADQENKALRAEIERLNTDASIAEQARSDLNMVPSGMQAFVVKGLPDEAEERASGTEQQSVAPEPLSPFDRLADLWRTLSQ
jgi:cell division protein FtsB